MNWNPWLWRQKAFFCADDSMSKSHAGFGSHWEVTCQQKDFQLEGPVPGAVPLGGVPYPAISQHRDFWSLGVQRVWGRSEGQVWAWGARGTQGSEGVGYVLLVFTGHLPIFAMTDEKEPSNIHTPGHAGTLEGYQSWSLDPRPLAQPQKLCCGDESRRCTVLTHSTGH